MDAASMLGKRSKAGAAHRGCLGNARWHGLAGGREFDSLERKVGPGDPHRSHHKLAPGGQLSIQSKKGGGKGRDAVGLDAAG